VQKKLQQSQNIGKTVMASQDEELATLQDLIKAKRTNTADHTIYDMNIRLSIAETRELSGD